MWIVLSIGAALLWACISLIDKFVMGNEMKDALLANAISGLTLFSGFTLIWLVFGQGSVPVFVAAVCLIAGFMNRFANLLYFFAVKRTEISRINPLINIKSLATIVLAAIFLGEVFSIVQYAGMLLIVISAIMLVFKRSHNHWQFDTGMLFAICAALCYSIPLLLIKISIPYVQNVWSIFLWIGIGHLLMSAILFVMHHPHIRKKAEKKALFHLVGSAGLNTIANIMITHALAIGPASIISVLTHLEPFFALVLIGLAANLWPKYFGESTSKAAWMQKIGATAVMFTGLLLLF